MEVIIKALGWASLAFSVVGFIETLISLLKLGSYNLRRVIVYSVLLGIGVALIK